MRAFFAWLWRIDISLDSRLEALRKITGNEKDIRNGLPKDSASGDDEATTSPEA